MDLQYLAGGALALVTVAGFGLLLDRARRIARPKRKDPPA